MHSEVHAPIDQLKCLQEQDTGNRISTNEDDKVLMCYEVRKFKYSLHLTLTMFMLVSFGSNRIST